MLKKALAAAVLLTLVSVAGSEAAMSYVKGAWVIQFPGPNVYTYANVIAAGALTPTVPDRDYLLPGTAVGGFGLYVRSDDHEESLGLVNRADATARYNFTTDPPAPAPAPVAGTLHTKVNIKGDAEGGSPQRMNGVAAIGDTAIDVQFSAKVLPTGGTSANVIINCEAMVQRTIAGPGVGRVQLTVYPDSVTANLDVTGSGSGALFRGVLIVDKDGIEKAEGNFAPGDFTVQLTTDRVRVRAVNVTKAIACPNSALLATVLGSDEGAQAVPGSSPFIIGVLTLLLAGAGAMMLRRKTLTA